MIPYRDVRKPRFGSLAPFMDSSMRETLKRCEMRFFYEYALGLKLTGRVSIHLNAGKAFAKAQEVFRVAYFGQGVEFEKAIGMAIKALIVEYGDPAQYQDVKDAEWMGPKSLDSMVAAFSRYYMDWHPDKDRLRPYEGAHKIGAEFSFSHPIAVEHPEGMPFVYVGRFDLLGKIFKSVVGVDEKTSKQLGGQWAKKWVLRGQFTGYAWGARESGIDLQYMVVRGISAQKGEIKLEQSISPQPDWKVQRWYKEMCKDVERLVDIWDKGSWSYALGDACTDYGGCPYMMLCKAADPVPLMKDHYVVQFWNPLEEEQK